MFLLQKFTRKLHLNFISSILLYNCLSETKIIRIMNDDYDYTKDDLDNYSDQLNDNNDAYWQSRGYDERPDDWEENED